MRYGRLVALLSALTVTAIAVLGGVGVVPGSGLAAREGDFDAAAFMGSRIEPTEPTRAEESAPSTGSRRERQPASPDRSVVPEPTVDAGADVTVPADSGDGRRVVFSQSRQRVWLIDDAEEVTRTYLVSGSVYDNLDPGEYAVYSRSQDAVGVDNSGTMKYFVRFAHGDTGAAIGFHDIPVDDGHRLQSLDDLGTPMSHGCVRQRRSDAKALWDFAPLGTRVVVVA